jgi:hypothetical protein
MDKQAIEKIVDRCKDLTDISANWRSYFQELAKYCLPRKAWVISQKTKGQKLVLDEVFDSTAIRGLKIMGAGFASNLTNPASKWFNLRTRNLEIMKNKDVQTWFKDVEDIIFATFASSNWDTTIQEFYLNAGCFGTGVVLTLDDLEEKVRFTEIPIEQVVMEEDAYGRVNRIYRTFPLTAQQAFDLWGKDAGEAVQEIIKKKPQETMKFLHYVGPRDERDPAKSDSVNMSYKSLYIELTKKHQIKEGGFRDNPYAVGRFYKDTADVFGYSPAMDVLPDIKLVQAQVKTLLRSAMKQADPALIVPRRGFIAPLNANPGKINYRDEKTPNDAVTVIPSGSNAQFTFEVIKETQANIEKAFFVPLFQAISNITKQMTIPEVQRRIAENMVLLGPVVGRFTQEVLDPIVMRVFNILWEKGEIPIPPMEVAGQEMDIVYISPLARAQRESAIYSIESFMQDVGLVATAIPDVIDKIKGDNLVDEIATIRGISPEAIKSDDEVAEIRKARAEQQAKMLQAQMLQQGVEMVKTGSEAAKNLQPQEAK